MMTILLLEDDNNLHVSLKAYLEMEGFHVTSAFRSDDVYNLTYERQFDLYIFDVNVPGDNGFTILKSLKDAHDTTPTIYITALRDIASLSDGFESGADDYIKKPFDPEELVVRIKSRYMKANEIIYGTLSYNPIERELLQDGSVVTLSNVLSNIFHELMTRKNKIVPLEDLYDSLEHPNPNALRVNVSKLKSRLQLNIKSIRGVGYMLEEL